MAVEALKGSVWFTMIGLIWVGLIKREKAAGSGLSAWVCYCAAEDPVTRYLNKYNK